MASEIACSRLRLETAELVRAAPGTCWALIIGEDGAGRVVEVVARLSGAWVEGSLLGALLRVSCENPVTPHSKIRTTVEADLARLIIKTVRAAAKSRDDSVPTCDAKGILTRPDYSQAKN